MSSSATWKRHPHSSVYNDDSNWSGGHTPASVATFGASSITHLTVSDYVAIGGWHFKKGAPHYFFSTTASTALIFDDDGIVNKHSGVTITNHYTLYFYNFAKAGSAHITNNAFITFYDSTRAGSAHITNNNSIFFYGHSSADRAVIATTSNVFFREHSDGGTARLIAKTGGMFDFSSSTGANDHPGILHAGSIEGAGTYYLGGNYLIVGGNNRSTTVSGAIRDGGESGGSVATLEKIGHGTLKLAHANNSFTGGIALTAGTLDIAAFEAAGPGGIAFGSGRQTLKIENGAFSSFDFGTEIHLFGAGDKLVLPGLKFHKHAIAAYVPPNNILVVTSGNVTYTFSQFYDPQTTHFKAVNDGHGGTKVVLVVPHAKPHAADSFHFSDATVEAGSRPAAEPHFAPAASAQYDSQPPHANLGDAADASFVAYHEQAGLADFAHGGDVFV